MSPLLIIFVTVFIDLLGFGIIIPLLPFYAERFGGGGLTVGLLSVSFSLIVAFSRFEATFALFSEHRHHFTPSMIGNMFAYVGVLAGVVQQSISGPQRDRRVGYPVARRAPLARRASRAWPEIPAGSSRALRDAPPHDRVQGRGRRRRCQPQSREPRAESPACRGLGLGGPAEPL